MFNPELRELSAQNIGYIDNKERVESAFNKKYRLIINLEPQQHRLWLQFIWYIGRWEKFDSTFLKITYE